MSCFYNPELESWAVKHRRELGEASGGIYLNLKVEQEEQIAFKAKQKRLERNTGRQLLSNFNANYSYPSKEYPQDPR